MSTVMSLDDEGDVCLVVSCNPSEPIVVYHPAENRLVSLSEALTKDLKVSKGRWVALFMKDDIVVCVRRHPPIMTTFLSPEGDILLECACAVPGSVKEGYAFQCKKGYLWGPFPQWVVDHAHIMDNIKLEKNRPYDVVVKFLQTPVPSASSRLPCHFELVSVLRTNDDDEILLDFAESPWEEHSRNSALFKLDQTALINRPNAASVSSQDTFRGVVSTSRPSNQVAGGTTYFVWCRTTGEVPISPAVLDDVNIDVGLFITFKIRTKGLSSRSSWATNIRVIGALRPTKAVHDHSIRRVSICCVINVKEKCQVATDNFLGTLSCHHLPFLLEDAGYSMKQCVGRPIRCWCRIRIHDCADVQWEVYQLDDQLFDTTTGDNANLDITDEKELAHVDDVRAVDEIPGETLITFD